VRRALAALEPALRNSIAKLENLNIRLLPARFMFFIQVRGLIRSRPAFDHCQ
jgi:hypothetical protein